MTEHVCADYGKQTECNTKAEVDVFECTICGDCWDEECVHMMDESFVGGIKPGNTVRLIHGNVLKSLALLPDKSIHTVVTSPPYWGVRDYKLGDAEIGAEETFDKFLENIVLLFREIKRVLHPTGTIWVNMGDSYNSEHSQGYYGDQSAHGRKPHGHKRRTIKGLHSKNMLGQPWQVAIALQKDGWILRDDIIWVKTNAGPFSGTDRTTKSHEYMFLLSKQTKYFFDWKAIEEESANAPKLTKAESLYILNALPSTGGTDEVNVVKLRKKIRDLAEGDDGTRRKRSVWMVPTESYPKAHYSTFPQRLVEPCIKATTSEKGCCPVCLAPIKRVLEKDHSKTENHGGLRKRADAPGAEVSKTSVYRTGQTAPWVTVGWKKTCDHEFDQAIPCTVLDPFMGSGTTAVVAEKLKRNAVGVELCPNSIVLAQERITESSGSSLFTDFILEDGPK